MTQPPRTPSAPGHVAWYAIDDADITSSAGAPVRVPPGRYAVERRSLVYRLRVGGREVDLTLREFDRLLQRGRIRPADVSGSAGMC